MNHPVETRLGVATQECRLAAGAIFVKRGLGHDNPTCLSFRSHSGAEIDGQSKAHVMTSTTPPPSSEPPEGKRIARTRLWAPPPVKSHLTNGVRGVIQAPLLTWIGDGNVGPFLPVLEGVRSRSS